MPWDRGGGSGRGRYALLEYRKARGAVFRRLSIGWIALPVPTVIPARVIAVRSDHNDTWSIVERSVAVVIRVRVARVIRSADHNLSCEIRIAKTQRDANPRLGRRDSGSDTKQESDDDEDAFHDCLLGCRLT